jgi:hypothetical protein
MYQIGLAEYNGYIKIRTCDLDKLVNPLELLKKRKIMMYFDRKIDFYDFIEHRVVMLRGDGKFMLDLADYKCTSDIEFALRMGFYGSVDNGVEYKKLEIID